MHLHSLLSQQGSKRKKIPPSFISLFPPTRFNAGVRVLAVRHVHGEPGGPPRQLEPGLGAQGREGQGRGGYEVIGKTLFGK